jgi:hypothetical protein
MLVTTEWKQFLDGLAHHVYKAVEDGRNGPPIRAYAVDGDVAAAYQLACAALDSVADPAGPNDAMLAALEDINEKLSRRQAPPKEADTTAASLPPPSCENGNPAAAPTSGSMTPEAPAELPDLVTLDKAAAAVHRSKRTLERYKTKGTLPEPTIEGGGGKPALYDWKTLRPWLVKEFGVMLPERYWKG